MSARKVPLSTGCEEDVIARVGKTPVVHGRGMRDLVGLDVGLRQGEPLTSMSLDFGLQCGTAALNVNGASYEISLRTCILSLDLEGCEVKANSRYEHHLTQGAFESSATETLERKQDRSFAASLEAGGSISPAPGMFARILGRVSGSKQTGSSSQQTTRRQPRVDLVVPAGHNRWQVGDPRHGDARRGDRKLFGPYFNEHDGEGSPKPLCLLVGHDAGTSMITVSVAARFGQVLVTRDGEGADASEREDVDLALRAAGKRAHNAHRGVATELRSRMAGLVLAKAAQAARGDVDPPGEGELLVARCSVSLVSRRGLARGEPDG